MSNLVQKTLFVVFIRFILICPDAFCQTLNAGQAVVIIHVESQAQNFYPIKFDRTDFILGRQDTYYAYVDSTGVYKAELPLSNTMDIFWSYDSVSTGRVILSPADTLSIFIGSGGTITYRGKTAVACDDLARLSTNRLSYESLEKAISMEPAEYWKFRKEFREKELSALAKHCTNGKCSPLFQLWYSKDIHVRYLTDLTNYSWKSIKYGLGSTHRLTKEQRVAYDMLFELEIDLADSMYCLSSSYFSLLTNLKNRSITYNDPLLLVEYFKTKIQFLLELKNQFSANEVEVLEKIYNGCNSDKEIDSASLDLYWKIIDQYDPSIQVKHKRYWFDRYLAEIQRIEDRNFRELFLCNTLNKKMDLNEDIDYVFGRIIPWVPNGDYKSAVTIRYNQAKTEDFTLGSDSSKGDFRSSAKAGEEVLGEIISGNKDKVILLDFWATWCGPCRVDFMNVNEVKSQTPDNVVYVYLCCESSEESWKKTVVKYDVKGQHYFINAHQYTYLQQKFKIQGFPTYVVIDRSSQFHRSIPGPSNKGQLISALKRFAK